MEKAIILIFSLFLFASCSRFSGDSQPVAPFVVSTGNSNSQNLTSGPTDDLPNSIKINVFIGKRFDLKVKTGDKLKAGDVLTDRRDERAALVEQRKQLNLSLRQIAETLKATRKPFNELPNVSFNEQHSAIRRAETIVSNGRERANRQQTKLATMEKMNLTESVTAHEQALLSQIEADLRAAQSESDLAKAQLKTAREKRRFDEFQNNVRVEKDTADYQKNLQIAAINSANINSQIVALDAQLQKLGTVRVPFSGTVTRINWEGQKDNEISVFIYFTVGDSNKGANN